MASLCPRPPVLCNMGRASAGRIGLFISRKNVSILPIVELCRTGTGVAAHTLVGTLYQCCSLLFNTLQHTEHRLRV